MLMISDNVWNEISSVIPEKKSKVGRPPKDAKIILSGVLYVMVTGVQWHKLPDYYGRPTTVCQAPIFSTTLNWNY
jgi:putative transposase